MHFDPPADDKDYVHRSGRTGRAGATGIVVTLVGQEHLKDMLALQRALVCDRLPQPRNGATRPAAATVAEAHGRRSREAPGDPQQRSEGGSERRSSRRYIHEDRVQQYRDIEREMNAMRPPLKGKPVDEILPMLERRFGADIEGRTLEKCAPPP